MRYLVVSVNKSSQKPWKYITVQIIKNCAYGKHGEHKYNKHIKIKHQTTIFYVYVK